MTVQSISPVVQQAVEWTGMEHVPVQDRTRHHGSGYLARAFEDYLRMLAVRHICCYSSPPQSNGKLARFQQRLNARVNLVVYTGPDQLRAGRVHRLLQPPGLRRRHWEYDAGLTGTTAEEKKS